MSLNATFTDDIRSLERRVAGDPAGLVFARLADAYRKAGLLSRALEVVDRGLHRHPDYLNARLVRARVLRDLGRRADAVSAFEAVLEIDVSNQVALRALGDLAGEAGDFEVARDWYARLLEAEPFAEEPVRALLDRLPTSAESPSPSRDAVAHAETRRVEPLAPEAESTPAGEAAPARKPAAGAETAPQQAPVPRTGEGPTSESAGGAMPEPAEAVVGESGGEMREEAVDELEAVARETGGAASETAPGDETDDVVEGEKGEKDREMRSERPTDELVTPTLADLYLQQGLIDEAVRIYERLVARRPDDLELAEKLKAARARVARRSSTSAPQAKTPKAVPEEARESASPAAHAARTAHEEAPTGPSIRRYLDDLLEGRPAGDPSEGSGGSRFERWLRAIRGV
jgi:tetratricopeptide (TPR) repeat protein